MLTAVVHLDIILHVPKPIALDKALWDKYLEIIKAYDLEFRKKEDTGNLIVLSQAFQKIPGMAKGSISSSMGRASTTACNLSFSLCRYMFPFILELGMVNNNFNGLYIEESRSESDKFPYFPIYKSLGYYTTKHLGSSCLQYDAIGLGTHQLMRHTPKSANVEYFKTIQENLFCLNEEGLNQKQCMDIFNAQKMLDN